MGLLIAMPMVDIRLFPQDAYDWFCRASAQEYRIAHVVNVLLRREDIFLEKREHFRSLFKCWN